MQDYVRGNTALRHDIAILKLNTPLDLNPYVQPACLPRTDFHLPPNRNVKYYLTGFCKKAFILFLFLLYLTIELIL